MTKKKPTTKRKAIGGKRKIAPTRATRKPTRKKKEPELGRMIPTAAAAQAIASLDMDKIDLRIITDNEWKELQAQVATIEERVDHINVRELWAHQHGLDKQTEQHELQIAALSGTLHNAESRLASLSDISVNDMERLKALEAAIPAFSGLRGSDFVGMPDRVTELEEQTDKMNLMIVDLGVTIATVSSSVTALQTPATLVYKLTANIGTVAQKTSEQEKLIERLVTRADGSDELIVALRDQGARDRERIEVLQSTAEALQMIVEQHHATLFPEKLDTDDANVRDMREQREKEYEQAVRTPPETDAGPTDKPSDAVPSHRRTLRRGVPDPTDKG